MYQMQHVSNYLSFLKWNNIPLYDILHFCQSIKVSRDTEWLLPPATLNNAIVNIGLGYLLRSLLPLRIFPEVELLDYEVIPMF